MLMIAIDRPDKANAIDADIIAGLSRAYADLSEDKGLRVGLLYGMGAHFTGGLDLASVGPSTKPIVTAVQGRCFTAGLELVLNSDICVAAEDTVFGQQEVSRGIVALGGATVRLPSRVGWGNAMRYLLTGDHFDAAEALRIGVIQEVLPTGTQVTRALDIANRIAAQAPMAVQATLAEARAALGGSAAAARLREIAPALLATADAQEGIASLIERRTPVFTGG